jgi:hypothetical protein
MVVLRCPIRCGGIGTTNPLYELHVAGIVSADDYYHNSDIRWKKDI